MSPRRFWCPLPGLAAFLASVVLIGSALFTVARPPEPDQHREALTSRYLRRTKARFHRVQRAVGEFLGVRR